MLLLLFGYFIVGISLVLLLLLLLVVLGMRLMCVIVWLLVVKLVSRFWVWLSLGLFLLSM